TGAWASCILPLLPPNRTRYCLTDISEEALNQAKSTFSTVDFMDYAVFDLRKKPEEQDMPLNAFDLVLSSMVLNPIPDVHKAVDGICRMTAAGGLFFLLEPTGDFCWYHLVQGSSETIAWKDVLIANGFEEAEPVSPFSYGPPCEFRLTMAKKPLPTTVETTGGREPPFSGVEGEAELRSCILFADDSGVAERLADVLRCNGVKDLKLIYKGVAIEKSEPSNLAINPHRPDDYGEMLEWICRDTKGPITLVNLWSIEDRKTQPSGPANPSPSVNDATEMGVQTISNCTNAIYMIQNLLKQDRGKSASLWTITTGTQTLGGVRELALGQTPLWGLVRVMATEYPEMRFKTIDLSPKPSDIELKHLSRLLLHPDAENELVLREKFRFVHRLVRKECHHSPQNGILPYGLASTKPRSLEGLAFVEKRRTPPGPGEVEISVRATGINRKDILKATGILEHLSDYDSNLLATFGFECSGVVVQVGEGVSEFKIGDEIMGLADGSFANFTTAKAATLIHKPGHVSFEEAAAMPVAYVTAHYSLVRLAGIKKGDRILIHAATGGVGLAAMNIARQAGAEIFATAGSAEKRDFLNALGLRYVGDSRSLAFEEEIRHLTKNEGVDIILNTLSGKAIRKGMALLKPMSGRFVDISNIYNESLNVCHPEQGISLFTFDLERMKPSFISG
ncbi:MAG TPA: zinc-binding dehydrogenase, partial [Candidatus Ozemobacteraceae bacterium]|nr:zinc-binding dehydrogenase [Candidatus Ozemobacteraceae bacterium]